MTIKVKNPKTSKNNINKSNKTKNNIEEFEGDVDNYDSENEVKLTKNNKKIVKSRKSKKIEKSDVEGDYQIITKKHTKPKKSKKMEESDDENDDENDENDENDEDNNNDEDNENDESDGEYDNKDNKKKSSKNNSNLIKKDSKIDDKILEIKTTHTGALKQVIERISNVISDCCIVFIAPDTDNDNSSDDEDFEEVENAKEPKKNKDIGKTRKTQKSPKQKSPVSKNTGGIRIVRLTEDKNTLVKVVLDADNFDFFRCDEPKITIGVDMHILHGLLKMVNDDDPIVMYMKGSMRNSLYIRSIIENNDNSEETDIELFLMDIPNTELPSLRGTFQNKITMKSDKFHLICKHLNNNSTFVEITSINNEILFRGQSEGGKVTKSYRDNDYNNKKKDKPDQVVQGVYELKNLLGFSKCNKLCNTIEIYLKNDFPLVLVISVAALGKMYVFLSPIENGNN
ncbi:putative DNA polymerase sliding clamp [Cotonvirus japonicus]|uniref:DNA polymerase sliding clamp n=1 Tax=Cotonvirus japonicus TaxID=2811091 RepID=A0ABM7NSC9_9VIRU|nr:putative DNA polymerase sliding clamp [Cotonvirus japonicus]BCS83041.1 putative DNA polymerase sliding clamp [Cotonvirus japonicus]